MNSIIYQPYKQIVVRCRKLGIKLGVDYTTTETGYRNYHRIIFTLTHTANIHECAELNGLIVDQETKKVICMPTKLNIPTDKQPEQDVEMYHIFDGSIVNLYNYKGNWVISTSSGYDVNTFTRGKVSFMDALTQCGVIFGDLDPKKCYTFGFNHPSHHPYNNNRMTLWKLQDFDLAKYNSTKNYDACVGYSDFTWCKNVVPVKEINEFGCIYKNNGISYLYKTEQMQSIVKVAYLNVDKHLYDLYGETYLIYRLYLNPGLQSYKSLFPQFDTKLNAIDSAINDFIRFFIMANKIKNKKKIESETYYALYQCIMGNSSLKNINYVDLEIEGVVSDLLKSERFISMYLSFFEK